MKNNIKQMLKLIPGLHTLVRKLRGQSQIYPVKSYVFERVPVQQEDDQRSRELTNLKNVLTYTKTSQSVYSADPYPAGYHTLNVHGETLKGQRQPSERLAQVPFDFAGKTVLDIGSNQGGMLFAVADQIKAGVGLDYDSRMTNAANKIKSVMGHQHLNFFVFDLEKDAFGLVEDFLGSDQVDIIFLLSVCMWIENWKDVITYCAGLSDTMLFETNGSREQQDEQEAFLRTCYTKFDRLAETSEDDPVQKHRRLILCSR